jgi:hypothetical protein
MNNSAVAALMIRLDLIPPPRNKVKPHWRSTHSRVKTYRVLLGLVEVVNPPGGILHVDKTKPIRLHRHARRARNLATPADT